MLRIAIKIDLERRLRECRGTERELVDEIVGLIDEERGKKTKRDTGSEDSATGKPGVGYKELVSLFRFYLGSELAVPPKPSPEWVIRQVILAKNMGVDTSNVEQICRGLRRRHPRGPYQLHYILRQSDVYYNLGSQDRGVVQEGVSGRGLSSHTESVFTGRLQSDDTEIDADD